MRIIRASAAAGRIIRVACRQRIADRANRRAGRGDLDELVGTDDVRPPRSGNATHLGLFNRGLNLLQVADASIHLRSLAVTYEVRDRNSCQNGDDGDHDHDFYEGKTLQHLFHGCVPFCLFCLLRRHHADTKTYMQILCQLKKYGDKYNFTARYMHIRFFVASRFLLHK